MHAPSIFLSVLFVINSTYMANNGPLVGCLTRGPIIKTSPSLLWWPHLTELTGGELKRNRTAKGPGSSPAIVYSMGHKATVITCSEATTYLQNQGFNWRVPCFSY